MISKELLDQVMAFEKGRLRYVGNSCADTYTLHFKQWWKRKMVMTFDCVTTKIHDDGTYEYHSTPTSFEFHKILLAHIGQSYDNFLIDENTKKCPVLTLVPRDDDK